MKNILLIVLSFLTLITAFAKDNNKKSINDIDKSIKKYESKLIEKNKRSYIIMEDSTVVHFIYRKYINSDNKIMKISIDYIHDTGCAKEIYYFNSNGILIKAISQTFSYNDVESKETIVDVYDLTNECVIYFVNNSTIFFVNGRLSYPSQDVIEYTMRDIRESFAIFPTF